MLQDLEHNFGAPVVKTEIGGPTGGGAQLTELGRNVLEAFRDIERNAGRAAATEMAKLNAMIRPNARPRRHH
jgi:molybdate transport system regulatory protein